MFKMTSSISFSVMLYVLTLLTTVSCKIQKPNNSTNISQGVEGYIYELTGNQMPMKGKTTNRDKRGVKREVYIYQAASLQQIEGSTPLFDKVKTPLVTKTTSGKDGHYNANLPIGNYSVFIKEDGKLFAAETDGRGMLNPVAITLNTITHRDITITVNAAF